METEFCSPRGSVGCVGVQEVVEGVEGGAWVVTASREVAGIHGGVDGKLPGSLMAAASPVGSRVRSHSL